MVDWKMLGHALAEQKRFSDIFFDSDRMSHKEKEDLLKAFVLSLHSEASGIIESVNYKDHRQVKHPVDTQKILYKSVDAYRYILAMLNLWGISDVTFADALQQKDEYLHFRHEIDSKKRRDDQPVVLFDLDDCLADFRLSFCEFVSEDSGVFIDPACNEYYNVTRFRQAGLNSAEYFGKFIDAHGFLHLKRNRRYYDLLTYLKSRGYWVQILTARPESNLTCFHDTYSWLKRNDIPADAVAFSSEKFSWLSQQPYFSKGKYFAVDDSAKHSAEYAKHGVTVIVPQQTYNTEVKDLSDVVYVPSDIDIIQYVSSKIDL